MHHESVVLPIMIGGGAILAIGSLMFVISEKIKIVPYTFLLFLCGIILSSLEIPYLNVLAPTADNVLFIYLPILLFESAYSFEFQNFKKIIKPAFLLATVGLIISAVIVALVLSLGFGIPFLHALLYGCVISSTDPIAVLTIFKQLGVPRRLQLFVDGESFLNDGTSVIGFKIVLALIAAGAHSSITMGTIGTALMNFTIVFVGGLIVGSVVGYLAVMAIKKLQENAHNIELIITIVVAHIAFIVADHYLKVSGIIAVLAAGIIMGNLGHKELSKTAEKEMHTIWQFMAFVVTTIVFFIIGHEIDLVDLWNNRVIVLSATIALLIGRAVSTYVTTYFYNLRAKKSLQIPMSWQHVANWGGLRGVLPLVVILSLPENFAHKELFINLVFGAILFTLTVNALTISGLIKKLNIKSQE